MGEVVSFLCPGSVEFDDQALALVARLTLVASKTTSIAMRSEGFPDVRAKALALFEEIRNPMEAIEEHISIIESNVDMILDILSEGEEVYFEHVARNNKLTVMSVMMKRCSSLRIRRFFTTKNSCRHLQDNDIVCLEYCDGSIACALPGRPPDMVEDAAQKRRRSDR